MAKKNKVSTDEIAETAIQNVTEIMEVVETEIIEKVIEPNLIPFILLKDLEINGQNGIEVRKKGDTIYLTDQSIKEFKQLKYIK